ncbi:putative methyltransferase [Ktedonobacter robiniae]|uniref:Methyltransferase n=2 Tax=Ktedonobacter robiniae TaxID=2778365 RepID=A0ABQ3USQ2_9CHLR|nr:putative methyltransferase [Ktedonobacter robiniae]
MLTGMIDVACRISPATKRFLLKIWFQALAQLDKEAQMLFMNYGYIDLRPDAGAIALQDEDEKDRYCIQLYHAVAGAITLKNLDVLEIGCGRGGGASYMMRYLQPKSVVGIDRCVTAVQFCREQYSVEGLSFSLGNAQSLPFRENTFDAVVNIESSHCYESMEDFLREVFRVLRPHGSFLFTDFRNKNHVEMLRKQLQDAGFVALEETCITPNVVRALDLDNQRKMNLIQQKIPKKLQKIFQLFAGVQGSKTYEAFRTGAVEYRSFVLCKGTIS